MCPGGSACPTPTDLPTGCADGYYSAAGAVTCIVCPAGSYCPGPPRDEEAMAPCPPGTYSESGSSLCSQCPKGSFCPDPAQLPEACPSGFYAHLGNMTECTRYLRAQRLSPSRHSTVVVGVPFRLRLEAFFVAHIHERFFRRVPALTASTLSLPRLHAPCLLPNPLHTNVQVHRRQCLPERCDVGTTVPGGLLQRRWGR